MDDKLERVIIDTYKSLRSQKEELYCDLRDINSRLETLECLLNDIGLRFDTDTIVVER